MAVAPGDFTSFRHYADVWNKWLRRPCYLDAGWRTTRDSGRPPVAVSTVYGIPKSHGQYRRRRRHWHAQQNPPPASHIAHKKSRQGLPGGLGLFSKELRLLSPTPADAQQAEGREGEGRRLGDGCCERGERGG